MKKDQVIRELTRMRDSVLQIDEAIAKRRELTNGYLDSDTVTSTFARQLVDLNRDLARMAIRVEEEL
jgi:Mg2+ and Co2+ transporter CorA